MKLQKSKVDYEQHPEGTFKARVVNAMEENDGPYGASIKIVYRTEHKQGDEYSELWDFVSNRDGVFRPTRTKLVNRLTGILGVKTFDDLPEQLELADLEGKLVLLKVIHNDEGKNRVDTVLPYQEDEAAEPPEKEPLLSKVPAIEDGFDDNIPF